MSKRSQLDRAIAALEADRQVLDLAILKLQQQREAGKPVRVTKPRLAVEKTGGRHDD